FGTGYSSLAHLKKFPIDMLKIDKSFVDGLGRDPEDTAIVATIVGMAHALELLVVAEGVETEDQLERLRALGCEEVQGYLLGRPGEASVIADMLSKDASRVAGSSTGPRRGGGLNADRVLVVDDAPDVTILTRASLTSVGFEVHEATTGAEALAAARSLRPGAIILDVSLPDVSGLEVCAALRADPLTKECTIVMLTGHDSGEGKAAAFSLGADDYIVKPFAPKDLVSRLRAAVRRRSGVTP
ncbi:MAG: EAL domain-containing protein, partial [Actinomycetota bacterium]|nr:EAL domain-containing protein [Actinomycetota bacterium]